MSTVDKNALSHLRNLIDGIAPLKRRRVWQREFETTIAANAAQQGSLAGIEQMLARLPNAAWQVLKAAILGQIDLHNPARGWTQALPLLNEARAYDYLVRQGYDDVEFLAPQAHMKSPDLRASRNGKALLCEVKTILVQADRPDDAFIKKLATRLQDAKKQLLACDEDITVDRLIYLVLNIDDKFRLLANKRAEQIRAFIATNVASELNVVLDYEADS